MSFISPASYKNLKTHIGHNLSILEYEHPGEGYEEVAVECEDCNKLLYSAFKTEHDNENQFEIGTSR